ncbi:MAG TPA: fused MFS/spermidine synthase [Thermoanaerobaculia bacterium]
MKPKISLAAALLFGSGVSALIYQTTWLREFRLIFGASTYATAAVLAIFMGGLGFGSAILGKRADLRDAPLRWYGTLELLIATSAALSPLLLAIVRRLYIALGGSVTLGNLGATIVRLILAALVLGIPTFLMGGTLPAAARAVETSDDRGRRNLALLYGTNTLGAVTGTLLATFYLLEHLGNRRTLLSGVALNVIVGAIAVTVGRAQSAERSEAREHGPALRPPPSALPVLIASAVSGFAFLLMELVWYRILTPLLGGTTFTFGLILAAALLGIGLGGAAYSFWSGGGTPTAGAFAITCTLEALAMIVPFALGDRLAVFTNLLRALGKTGFGGDVAGWSIVTLIVVFPAALIAGIQFPILIALLGTGREDVGRDVGLAYAWNTAGAIAGSLAGGFGLLPLLTAPGCWRLVVSLLVALGLAAAMLATRDRQFVASATTALIAAAAIAGIFALGPTAVWRHTGIGAGRASMPDTINGIRGWINASRRQLRWDADGRESAIAILDMDDRVFITNGKADGSARGDAGTQVMAGMIGAIVHPNARRSLVIGLGTGSTAGWLATVPSMERVDVVELEPSVLRVARDNAGVNHDALRNPKVHVRIADAREILLTTPQHYDIIFSEPSNPYRAGIASLYTAEFYRAAAARLNRGGMFLQWVQAYDIDTTTIKTIYATLRTVFPYIETWRTTEADLVLVGTREPLLYDIDMIRHRLSRDAYYDAMHLAWRVESAEGFFSNYVGNDKLAVALGTTPDLNTDDKTLIEFGFARTVGDRGRLDLNQVIDFARGMNANHPSRVRGFVDWHLAELNRWHDATYELSPFERDEQIRTREQFTKLYDGNDFVGALSQWQRQPFTPVNSTELVRIADVLAQEGSEDAIPLAEQLRAGEPTEADALIGRVRLRENRFDESLAALGRSFVRYRNDAWADEGVMGRALDAATTLAGYDRRYASRLYPLVDQPFSTGQWEDTRKIYRVTIAHAAEGCGPRTIASLRKLEPNFPWTFDMLRIRRECYSAAHLGDLARRAEEEWKEFEAGEPQPLTPR